MNKNLLIFTYVSFILVVIILTIISLKMQTKSRINATASTTLSLSSGGNVNTGQTVPLNVTINPGNNQVSFIKLVINYDSSKVVPASNGFVVGNIPGSNPPLPFGIFDGPNYNICNGNQCSLNVSLSIGNDFTKAVRVAGTIGILNFQAIAPTGSSGTQVSFDNTTQVLSIAPSDSSIENVLQSSNPSTIIINGQAITPTLTLTSTPTINPSATQNPTPSLTLTPTPGQTTGSISLHFEAIDSVNNPNPKHPQRKIILYFFKTNNFNDKPLKTINDFVTHIAGDTNGIFTNQAINLSSTDPGTYYILVKSPEGSLRELLNPQPVSIVQGQNNNLNGSSTNNNSSNNSSTFTTLRMGDLNNDNVVNIIDYNILVDCYDKKLLKPTCIGHRVSDNIKGNFADLNDDGTVNGIDYNMLIRHFGENGY